MQPEQLFTSNVHDIIPTIGVISTAFSPPITQLVTETRTEKLLSSLLSEAEAIAISIKMTINEI